MGSRLESGSSAVRKRIEQHEFTNEEGEEYNASSFGGFPDYFRRKKIKLQNLDAELRAASTDKPKIFKGIVCHVNGYTQPSLNDLHTMIVAHGGGFIQYLDSKTMVTHIIASSLTPKKAVEFRRYRIVKPAWIVDSIAAGKLQPWDRYRVVDEGENQKVLRFDNGKVLSQVNRRTRGYREQTDASWYTKQLADSQSSDPLVHEGGDDDEHSNAQPPFKREASPHDLPAAETITKDKSEDVAPGDEPVDKLTTNPQPEDDHLIQYVEDLVEVDSGDSKDKATSLGTGVQHVLDIAPPATAIPPDVPSVYMDPAEAEKIAGRKLTAEEHNSILLSDPRIRKSSTLNPDFLEQYYRESRLHHLSTWKADLKSQLQALAAEKSSSQKSLHKRAPRSRRYILHVDFDSFFVAVSLKNNPELIEKPCAVAHGAGQASEIASCNYPARKFGVSNGMWMKRAHELCKDLNVLPYDFPGYEAASRKFYDSILASGGVVQSVSIDEALVDVSKACHDAGGSDGTGINEGSIWREQEKAEQIAQSIRDTVKAKTGCAVSVGIGGNILLAKVALRKAKPAGQYRVKPEEALDFLAGLEVRNLPGVAYSIGGKLEENGITYVSDIRQVTKEKMASMLGPKTGEKLWNYSRGIDHTEVGDQVVRKSVSAEVNWGVRFETVEQAEEFVDSLAGELTRRLLKEQVRGRSLTMKILRRASDAPLDPPKHLGHGKCDSFAKTIMLGVSTTNKEVIAKEAISIMRGFAFSPGELRGLGLQMTKLEPLKQGDNSASSQRRLDFFRRAEETAAPKSEPQQDQATRQRDPDDPETPTKQTTQAVAAFAAPVFDNTPSKKRLNTAGTQFLLPTQVDPDVVKELPKDIRDRLQKCSSGHQPDFGRNATFSANNIASAITALPNQSQLDPGILDALPADLRTEILAEYSKQGISPPSKPTTGQTLLPQSPRKALNTHANNASRGRGRGRPRGSTNLLTRLKAARSDTPTLTQSNFVATTAHRVDEAHSDEDVSADILAALPEDIRQEVVEEQRKRQLARTGGIEVARRRHAQKLTDTAPKVLVLPPREPRPSFTSRKLSTVTHLREAVNAWVEEFRAEGPYKEDVDVLVRYLAEVVVREKDMNKAICVVRWLEWCLERDELLPDPERKLSGSTMGNVSEKGRIRWRRALTAVEKAVDDAVNERGLAPLDAGWASPSL